MSVVCKPLSDWCDYHVINENQKHDGKDFEGEERSGWDRERPDPSVHHAPLFNKCGEHLGICGKEDDTC